MHPSYTKTPKTKTKTQSNIPILLITPNASETTADTNSKIPPIVIHLDNWSNTAQLIMQKIPENPLNGNL